MSKQPNPPAPGPGHEPPTKWSRKMAGFRLARPQPSISQPPSASSSLLFVMTTSPEEVGGTPSAKTTAKAKRKRYTTNTDRLTEWLKFRETFLDEALRHDGLGDFLRHMSCSNCGKKDGTIKCKDCGDGGMLKCLDRTVDAHCRHPLHCIERWNSAFFEKVSLQSLGLYYQLGHSGVPCPCPQPGPKNFLIFDVSSPHYVTINYCHCQDEPSSNWVQLLRESWFPATLQRLQTIFTFRCLETFHKLTLQGKTNLYDYYHTLLRLSDNANLSAPIYQYPEIHRVFRMWRNLMALKRASRGHDPDGVSGTSQGGLMVECPACPHPEQNLPDGWERAGPLLFLYALFIAVDGNFKLKGKERNLKDVELMPGWGAYVLEDEYQKHLANYIGKGRRASPACS
ncbi:uncharacterized protein LACBIDRAFT_308173 [Laccaria bicolor S238N-H82]|uniref:Predicted protein n=1 Tax=Laccaria bicolor (strain S238N-H82 / ATCC MYA-4686) TaxID=486041 RepID=B0DRS1_LACBS|nr:uncharacterized protein LACBIDRAFT_308173 [Laccaria bicolor S238N-H82]EDR02658.1 predicted protein [Laccaria bicolor S238N-H82]|eukprot:XP_001886702.1 predicted protein [Laccaria bicolor S238N-H82]